MGLKFSCAHYLCVLCWSRRRWEENIRMDLKEIDISTSNWVNSAQDRGLLESRSDCGIEPPGSISHEVS